MRLNRCALWFSLACLTTAFVSGCSDDSGDKSKDKTCKEDISICSESETCNDEGKCVPKDDAPECSDEKPCADESKECSAEGKCVPKADAPECSDEKPCADDSKECNAEGKCVPKADEPECSDEKPCADDSKECNAEGKCVPKADEPECSDEKPCADDSKECNAEGKCVDKASDSSYCSDQKVIQFFTDHYELIHNLIVAHQEGKTQDDKCQAGKALTALFEADGKKLCDQVESCKETSVDAMYDCAAAYINGIILGTIEKPKTDDLITGSVVTAIYNAKEGTLCPTEKVTCDVKPEICGEYTCKNKECYKADEDRPAFCSDEKITKFLTDNYDLIHDVIAGEDKCKASKALSELFTTKGQEVCADIEYCSEGSENSFYQCAIQYIINIIAGIQTNPKPVEGEVINVSSITALINALGGQNCQKNCATSSQLCGEYTCKNDECYNETTPAFCSDEKVTKFFTDNYEVLHTFFKEQNCDNAKAITNLFTTKGKELCKDIDVCLTGSENSFYQCAIQYVINIIAGSVTNPHPEEKINISNVTALINALGGQYCSE